MNANKILKPLCPLPSLKIFALNLYMSENPKYKELFLKSTVFSLAEISTKLGIGKLTSDLKNVIQDLDFKQQDTESLMKLAVYFNKFNEPDGIIEMLSPPLCLVMGLPDVVDKCLELLKDTYPEYVEKWVAISESSNSEGEKTNESEPTE